MVTSVSGGVEKIVLWDLFIYFFCERCRDVLFLCDCEGHHHHFFSFLRETISIKLLSPSLSCLHSLTSREWLFMKPKGEMCLISQRQLRSFRGGSKGRLRFMSGVLNVMLFDMWRGNRARDGGGGDPTKTMLIKKLCIIYSTKSAGTSFETEICCHEGSFFFFFFLWWAQY